MSVAVFHAAMHRPFLLPALRAREWRCLLLALALLAAWARVLVPAHAAPHPAEGARALICAAAQDAPALAAIEGGGCELCRLPDLPAGLPAPLAAPEPPRAAAAHPRPGATAGAPTRAPDTPPARGPPGASDPA